MKAAEERRTEGALEPRLMTAPYREKRRVRSADLLAGSRELLIEHCGETYLLRHTSKGKLILTK